MMTDSQLALKLLFGRSLPDLRTLMASLGQPAYRATQLAQALYDQRVETLAEITTFPEFLRQSLAEAGYTIGLPILAPDRPLHRRH